MRRTIAVCVTGILIGVTVLALLVAVTANERWAGYLRLMRGGASCQATVVGIDPGERCRAVYRFSAGGRSYAGEGAACGLRVGEQVKVTYLVDDPSLSCLGSAGERLADEILSSLFGGLTFAPLS